MNRGNLFLGRAGEHAAMAEFLTRGYNVAIPEVDLGDDIFVVRDRDGDLTRIQVKTADIGSARRKASGDFKVGLTQLETDRTPDITFVFVARTDGGWGPFVVLPRSVLHQLFLSREAGRQITDRGKANILFKFHYESGPSLTVRCGALSLEPWKNNWDRWPSNRP